MTATGGSTTTVDLTTGNGVSHTTVAASAAGTGNAITMTCVGLCEVISVEPFLSTSTHLRMGMAGVGGTGASNWQGSAGNPYYSPDAIKDYSPDLTIIELGAERLRWRYFGLNLPGLFAKRHHGGESFRRRGDCAGLAAESRFHG